MCKFKFMKLINQKHTKFALYFPITVRFISYAKDHRCPDITVCPDLKRALFIVTITTHIRTYILTN
jgi:hypothetical protein